jgi:hypothetical protein
VSRYIPARTILKQNETMTQTWCFTLLCLVGCGTAVSFTPSGKTVPGTRAHEASDVELISVPPDRPYVQIGLIEAQQESEFSPDNNQVILHKMRTVAGQNGCHALLVQGANDAVVGGGISGINGNSSVKTLKGYRGACLVFTGPQRRPSHSTIPPTATPRCIPNESRLCYGPGGCRGGQACLPSGAAYSACDCGTVPAIAPSGD